MSQAGRQPATELTEAQLERAYVRLERSVFNVVYRWVWNRQTAAEIVQDTFCAVWNHRARVDPATLDAYVYRAAINRAKKHRRWARLRSFVGLGERELAGSGDPESEAVETQRALAVREALEKLPDKQREVMMLVQFSELPYGAIGDILGIPEGTVASRKNTAMKNLERYLRREHG